jgi:hypothetical protein
MLSLSQAQTALAAGHARAAVLGVPVNIAVLDAAAHLKAFGRMDEAVLGSIDVALGRPAPRPYSGSPAKRSGTTASPARRPPASNAATAA